MSSFIQSYSAIAVVKIVPMPQQRLIIFTRYPVPGKTKTRLIPALGADGAAQLQREMTELTLTNLYPLLQSTNLEIHIYYSGGDRDLMKAWLAPIVEKLDLEIIPRNTHAKYNALHYQAQANGDLGERMQQAFDEAFQSGINQTIIIGTDCPDLNSALITEAFSALHHHEVVLGPAQDGGYYLIGLNRSLPVLFQQIAWGSDRVLAQTQQIIKKHNLSHDLLKTLTDIDRPEDLWVLEKSIQREQRRFGKF